MTVISTWQLILFCKFIVTIKYYRMPKVVNVQQSKCLTVLIELRIITKLTEASDVTLNSFIALSQSDSFMRHEEQPVESRYVTILKSASSMS